LQDALINGLLLKQQLIRFEITTNSFW